MQRHLSSMLHVFSRSLSLNHRKPDNHHDDQHGGRTIQLPSVSLVEHKAVLQSSGSLRVADRSGCFVAAFSRCGQKASNQDCTLVFPAFGGDEDTVFCGVFDGHGAWGRHVAKAVRDALPLRLQDALARHAGDSEKMRDQLELWRHAHQVACASVDAELERHRRLDAFQSGTTALTLLKRGDMLVMANVGDSRAVLATSSGRDDGALTPIQLTVDLKPHLPEEADRIQQCNGRVHCLPDEPGVHRVWLPDKDFPGLAMSRAFGDYCLKKHGVTSTPEVTQRKITGKDHFVILATDGVWDVLTNEEAVQIVALAKERAKSARLLVECAIREWHHKRREFAADDCSAVCIFFDAGGSPANGVGG